ncbi:MAG: 8-amino-7-oxononanoate synthase [Geminocystis sp.]|nr:8-amino-7-oxononanoate synthase [Geminocystis sp.]HIK38904.1 8-amino-7-oxononanoate synthase [Geminocystis sp. M7585_C2015_104]MCS7148372.1 8-amino-7-oxononanoate synthase [Geminocystis sp.]MCX8078314.1 8-amino-7-oxononanoate synthase [Geminocystis sp.]MDW8116040.1 8-amino-7-oxononanoate synthase [Geminocystis sp.]
MSSSLHDYLAKSLETIKKANWYRQEKLISSLPGGVVEIEGRLLVNFASNDYLGLAGDARVIEAATQALYKYGTGSTGSRLLSGHRKLHEDLEKAIASWKRTEKALVFSSGYSANIGTICSLVKGRDLILEDEYNHSSLKNGAKLSQAKIVSYKHCDCADLTEKLSKLRPKHRHCLIVTDSVFSMDGDLCPLPELIAISEKFDCWLLLDDAHATGVLGKTGAGSVEHFGIDVTGKNIIQVGTLSKAIGSLGGYVAGSALLIDFLRNRCPTWIYTTALSPADTAAAIAAIEIIQQEANRREQLWHNINTLKQIFRRLQLPTLPSDSAIICLKCHNPPHALHLSLQLQKEGFFVPAIRPPTVPTSRLRFSVMATHLPQHFQQLASVLSHFPL